MKHTVHRPLMMFFTVFCFASWTMPFLEKKAKLFSMCACAAVFFTVFILKRHTHRGAISKFPYGAFFLVLLSIFVAILNSYVRFDIIYKNEAEKYNGEYAECEGRIEDVIGITGYSGIYELNIFAVDGKAEKMRVRFMTDTGELETGDLIKGSFAFTSLKDDVNGFDEERYCLSKNMTLSVESDDYRVNGHDESGMFFSRMNSKISGWLVAVLGRDAGGLASALLTGNKKYLDPGISFDFRTLGISHLLAISGMHLSIISAFLLVILKKFSLPRKFRCVVLILFTLIYMMLTGFPASVTRAGIMLIMSLAGEIVGRKGDPLTSLSVSAGIILIVRPFGVYDIGLQLSYTCVLAIIALNDSGVLSSQNINIKGKFMLIFAKVLKYISGLFIISVFTSLATLPFMFIYFGEIAVASPLSNLIFVPAVTLLMWILPIMLPFVAIVPAVSVLLQKLCMIIISMADFLSDALGKTVSLEYDFAPIIIIGITVSLAAAAFFKGEKRKGALGCVFGFAVVYSLLVFIHSCAICGNVEVITSNYKKSDAVIVTDAAACTIIDVSDGAFSAVRPAIEKMRSNCITEVDSLVLTHLHQRHVKTFGKLTDTVKICRLIVPEPVSETDKSVYEALKSSAKDRSIPFETYSREGGTVKCSANVSMLYNGYVLPSGTTHPAICFSILINENEILYAGSSFEKTDASDKISSGGLSGVIFGAHGPVSKNKNNLSGCTLPALISTSETLPENLLLPDNLIVLDSFLIRLKEKY